MTVWFVTGACEAEAPVLVKSAPASSILGLKSKQSLSSTTPSLDELNVPIEA